MNSMNAKEFFDSQLITDANSVIDKNKKSYNRFDVIKFAEAYGNKKLRDYFKNNKLHIVLDEYSHSCADVCCFDYGTRITVNGVEMEYHNDDTETILKQVLEYLGYDVKVETIYTK